MLPSISGVKESGHVAYRCLFTRQELEHTSHSESQIREILAEKRGICRLWLGPRAHAVFYAVKGSTIFNLVLIIGDEAFNRVSGLGQEGGTLARVRKFYREWDPS
jgi:salicylate hydroxylase